eukprot:SM000323S12629  [mRNA]  locus=s323:3620:6671:- [translate_table: standard]
MSARARSPGRTGEAAQRPSSATHVDVHVACGGDRSAANVLADDSRPALSLAAARTRRDAMAALAGIGLLTAAEERALSMAHAIPADISAATAAKTDGGLIVGGDESSGAPNMLKNVIITGGNSACRNKQRGEAAAEEIRAITANPYVSYGICDLSSLGSVRAFAASVVAGGHPLHVLVLLTSFFEKAELVKEEPVKFLSTFIWDIASASLHINNAGIMACPQTYTEDGFELQFEVNHLGHFLLTSLLLNTLALSASPGSRSRVVNVTSAAEQIGHLDFDDLHFKYSRKYDAWGSYAQSKLANCLFTKELARRCLINDLPITSNCLHPGIVDTQLIRWVLPQFVLERRAATPDISARFAKFIGLKTPEEGAEGVVYLASASEVEGKTGRYYNSCTEATPSQLAQDPALATRLWEVSMELTGAADVPAILPSVKARPVPAAVVV